MRRLTVSFVVLCLALASGSPVADKTAEKKYGFGDNEVIVSVNNINTDEVAYTVCEGKEINKKCKVHLESTDSNAENSDRVCDVNLSYDTSKPYWHALMLTKLGHNRVIFVIRDGKKANLIIVDMGNCGVKEASVELDELPDPKFSPKLALIPHENNFDVILSNKNLCKSPLCKVTYDYEGKVVNEASDFGKKVLTNNDFFSEINKGKLFTLYNVNKTSVHLIRNGACNRTVRNSVGWIRWTGRMGRCVVRIRAPLRDPQVIEMRIRRMQVGVLRNARCEGAYVQFSDELEDLDESAGRYCGHVTGNATRLFLRRGPDLTVVLDSESRFAAENPVIFSAQFSILPARLANERHHVHHQPSLAASSAGECPLECSNRNDRRTCRLVSPGYPGIYPRGMRCRVALESTAGRFRIGGTPDDVYNLMNHTSQEACRSEFCEQEHVDGGPMAPSADQPEEQRTASRVQTDRDEEDEIIIGQKQPAAEERPRARLKKHQQRRRSRGQHQPSRPRESATGADNEKPRKVSGEGPETDRSEHAVRMRHGGGQHRHRPGSSHQREKGSPDYGRIQLPVDGDDERITADRSINELTKPRRNPKTDQLFWSKNRSFPEQSGSDLQESPHQQYRRHLRRRRPHDISQSTLGSGSCAGDYLALLESVNGRVLEIGKFCGEGRFPQILSRGRNVIVEFHAERDGTIMHDGFHLSLQETEAPPASAPASPVLGYGERHQAGCDYLYKSSDKSRDSVKSPRSWYPPNTLCSYRFTGKPNERVSVLLKIVKYENSEDEDAQKGNRRNDTLDYCPGNEIAVYNGTHSNGSFLMWSFCDATHSDINNIQVPIVSTGSALLIQFYSAMGSYDGQDFTYSITYKFIKKPANTTRRRQVSVEETRLISLRPVNFSALNLSDSDSCNCDFADRIGTFKSWFIVLVVLGVISFVGAILTIIALLVKCAKMRAAENKLLQTPKRSSFFKSSTE